MLNRILNEVEGEVKSKMFVADGAAGGGGGVRVSDRVLEMELCVVWEAEKKWSHGVDLSEGTKEIRLEFKVVSRVLPFAPSHSISLPSGARSGAFLY